MKKGGNISIKLTNILKQTKECCDKKKCPKGSKRCKPSKKKRKKKDEDEGIFGGMPNIKPTSRAIPMPQSVMNNITPVPNIPMPIQLPAYSQFRRPHAMYQKNNRPYQTQQGITKTRGVKTDREIRGSIGTSDQPFNAPIPPPNILDYESIRMRNTENDRRDAARVLVQMVNQRIEGTIEDIGKGTPREEREQDEEEIKPLEQQIVGVKQLIGPEEEPRNQDNLTQGSGAGISDEPIRRRRGRPRRVIRTEIASENIGQLPTNDTLPIPDFPLYEEI